MSSPSQPSPRRPPRPQGPRVNLTLPEDLDAVLGRLCRAMGTGKASFIREMLIGSTPQLVQMAEAAEMMVARNIPEGLGLLAKTMREASGQAQQVEMQLGKKRRAIRRKK